MKLLSAVAASLALLGGGVVANAQLSFTLTPTGGPTGAFTLLGAIVNNTASTVVIDGGSFTVPAGVGVVDNFTDLGFTDLPLTLAPGSFYNLDPFLEVTVPAGTPSSFGTYDLTNNGVTLSTASFALGSSAVPEPGAVAMLVGGLAGGATFMARRRRN